ncbi:MAG: hypothetical protein ACRCTR_02125 [Actinomycetota bacterium]
MTKTRWGSLLAAVAWLGVTTTMQWSVVRYELFIVFVLTSATVILALALIRRWHFPLWSPVGLMMTLMGVAGVTWLVPFFSHSTPAEQQQLAAIMAITAVICGLVGMLGRHGPAFATLLAAVGTTGWTAWAIYVSPSPRIDVWVTLQQAAEALGDGINPYTVTWQDSPGVQDAFTYLPWTSVLTAPGRLVAGDVRWALLIAQLCGIGCVIAAGFATRNKSLATRSSHPEISARIWGAATLLALIPGTITQAEQAWTEPLLFACLAGWALLLQQGYSTWAIVPLALACASKQHVVLLLPILAVWAPFGWRRTLATGGLAGLLVLPWFITAPGEFWRDTVTLLVSFPPLRFANTWFIVAQNELDITPPFWLTGGVVLSSLGLICFVVKCRKPHLSDLIGWLALFLLVANLTNKQAFYNQYWLVAALILLAAAVSPARNSPEQTPALQNQPTSRLAGQSAHPNSTAE